MHYARSAHYGNIFVGAFGRSTDKLTFIGNAQEKLASACSKHLKTPVINMTVNASNLVGLFMAANSRGAILPEFVHKEELKTLEDNGMSAFLLRGRLSAVGNNIVANDKIAFANPDIGEESVRGVADCLGVEVIRRTIAGYRTVGSVCTLTNRGFLLHTAAQNELEDIEGITGLKGGIGTANMGVPFVGISLIANSNGYIAGEETGGFEFHRIDEALGFI